ncbi:MAG: AAA family ATPase [Verrucomicrobiota bacterium]|nr:AAA family ATPase [Verrucomicrobiota bacterium]
MNDRPRFYDNLLKDHFARNRQMAFVSGPRQVGKTTTCRSLGGAYYNWDNTADRKLFLTGPDALAEAMNLARARAVSPLVVLDELHKYTKWKGFLKGLFDSYADKMKIAVTGSSRLDIYRRGSDSLMGRYFLYRMHPWTVAESLNVDLPEGLFRQPQPIEEEDWQALWTHGGFPEPFLKRDIRFTRRWRSLRNDQLSKEDLRELTRIQELGTIEVLMQLLAENSSGQMIYANYANQLGVTIQTVKRWVDLLNHLHYGFSLQPWFASIPKALRKEPKWFLREWSGITNEGAKAETFVACHLLKAVDAWTDMGFGDFQLHYIRTTQKQEVDFAIVRDRKPWMLVEVKSGDTKLAPTLGLFQKELGTEYAFQVVINLPYEPIDCSTYRSPTIVPAKTFLSQLV